MEPLSAWTLLRSVLKVKKVAYFASEVNKGRKECWCVEYLLLLTVEYEGLRFWFSLLQSRASVLSGMPARSAAAVVSPGSLRHPGGCRVTEAWEARRRGRRARGSESLGPSDVLWGRRFALGCFCQFFLFCGRFFWSSGLFAYVLIGRPAVESVWTLGRKQTLLPLSSSDGVTATPVTQSLFYPP